MKLLKTKGRICNVPAFFIYFNSIIINFQMLPENSQLTIFGKYAHHIQ